MKRVGGNIFSPFQNRQNVERNHSEMQWNNVDRFWQGRQKINQEMKRAGVNIFSAFQNRPKAERNHSGVE